MTIKFNIQEWSAIKTDNNPPLFSMLENFDWTEETAFVFPYKWEQYNFFIKKWNLIPKLQWAKNYLEWLKIFIDDPAEEDEQNSTPGYREMIVDYILKLKIYYG